MDQQHRKTDRWANNTYNRQKNQQHYHTDRWTNKSTKRQIDKYKHRQIDRLTNITDKQTDGPTTPTNRQKPQQYRQI